jgi:hypothetical protein
MDLADIIEKLKAVAELVPEYEGDPQDIYLTIKESFDSFLVRYPHLSHCPDYLEFLRSTAGAFIDHPEFSLGIYGFNGYVVTSFEERRLFLDRHRYFHFGDVLYPKRGGEIYVFAFDFHSEKDEVYVAANERWEYELCSPSFKELLLGFAEGKYPRTRS